MNPIPEKNTVPLHVRNDFPSLQRKHRGKPVIYFDGPAGTQVPLAVIHAISE
ncbi:MAG TPA: cysteine desulfurase-like protein, partial [Bacteroidetes bacterium]|nr:cysteine desulfurase-like protein [Bacteroidota bacterium]